MAGSCQSKQLYNLRQGNTIVPIGPDGFVYYENCGNASDISNFLTIKTIPTRGPNNQLGFQIIIGTNEFLITGTAVLAAQVEVGRVLTSTFDNISPIDNNNSANITTKPKIFVDPVNSKVYRTEFVRFEILISPFNYVFQEESFFNDFRIYVQYIPGENVVTDGKVVPVPKTIINNQQEILIYSQPLIDFSDIGNTLFTVSDYQCLNYTKKFEKDCPKIVSVLKGKGNTAADKVDYIYIKYNLTIPTVELGLNLIEYSMVRYFLSKLLYNKWNIKFLLNEYYDDFLKDLQKSKFNNFVEYFTDPNYKTYGYNKFFLENI